MAGRAVEMMVASTAERTPVITVRKRAAKTNQKRQPLS